MNEVLKYILVSILFVAAIFLSVHFFILEGEDGKVVFTTDYVRRGDIERVVLTNGVLYPYKLVDVGSQAAGQIETIDVNLGDEIKQGDLIAQIDNLSQQNALKEAQAPSKVSMLNIKRNKRKSMEQVQNLKDRKKCYQMVLVLSQPTIVPRHL